MGANLCVFLQFVKLISRILESCRSMELLEVGMGRSSFSMMAAINFWVAILLGCFLFSCPEDGGFWRGEWLILIWAALLAGCLLFSCWAAYLFVLHSNSILPGRRLSLLSICWCCFCFVLIWAVDGWRLGLGGIGQEEGNDAPPLIRSDSQHWRERLGHKHTKSIGPNWMGERRHLGQEGV